MRINEVTNDRDFSNVKVMPAVGKAAGSAVRKATLGSASWLGGVAGQLGRKAFQKFTGLDPDTGETSDLYSLLMQQPHLLYHPKTQALIKKGLLSKEQLDAVSARAQEMERKNTPKTSDSAPAAPAAPGSTPPESAADSGPRIIDPATGKPFTTETKHRQRGISA